MGVMGSTGPHNVMSEKCKLIRHVHIWARAILKDIGNLPGLKGAQMITVLSHTLPVLPSVPQLTPTVLWGVPCEQLTVKEQAQGVMSKWIFMLCQP